MVHATDADQWQTTIWHGEPMNIGCQRKKDQRQPMVNAVLGYNISGYIPPSFTVVHIRVVLRVVFGGPDRQQPTAWLCGHFRIPDAAGGSVRVRPSIALFYISARSASFRDRNLRGGIVWAELWVMKWISWFVGPENMSLKDKMPRGRVYLHSILQPEPCMDATFNTIDLALQGNPFLFQYWFGGISG